MGAQRAGGAEHHPAVTEIGAAARECFGENLRLAFVAGSHARGEAKPTSDVDVLVLIDRPDREAERAFAQAFRTCHEYHGLKLDHYGEIFDVITAIRLIAYSETVLSISAAIQETACYHGDCILSVFRKGDVLLKFFLDPKLEVCGDRNLLAQLEREAERFFALYPMRRIQLEKGRLEVPETVEAAAAFREQEANCSDVGRIDSPVGIGLARWFSVDPIGLGTAIAAREAPQRAAMGPRQVCPLAWSAAETRLGRLVRHQCLGVASGGLE